MSDRRAPSGPSLIGLDAPSVDWSRLRAQTGVDRPKEVPSFLQSLNASARAAGGDDERQALLQRQAEDQAIGALVSDLRQRGFRGDYEWRPLPGAAPFYRVGNIWQDIARARAGDPTAFAGVEPDPEAYTRRIRAPIVAADQQRRETIDNSGWVPWLAGQFVGGMSDPINQASTVIGVGTARTIAQAALRDAGVNLRIEAAQTPERIVERAARGEDTTAAQVATELGFAAGAGALFGGGMKALERPVGAAIERAATPAGKLAAAMRERIGRERMTDAERAATAVLEREDDIAATSPFTPGAGTDAHATRIDRAIAAIAEAPGSRLDEIVPLAPSQPRPRIGTPEEAAARLAADPIEQFKQRLRAHESGGDDTARNTRSSATGRYQVIDATWLKVARTLPQAQNMSDATLLSMRDHPVWQERVVDQLIGDYRRTLARIGQPETPGNLYLMHFAGPGGATRILRADGDAAIETVMSDAAIRANPFLRGKTVDETIAWAERSMGGTGATAPRVRRDIFPEDAAGDAEWRAAQREVDAAEADFRDWQRDEAPPGMADEATDDIPFDLNDPRMRAGPARMTDDFPGDAPAPSPWAQALADLRGGRIAEAKGMLRHPALDGPIDIRWGEAGDPARNFKGGYGLAHILAKHPEMEAQLERLPELIADMTVAQRRDQRIILEGADHKASIALTWHGEDQRWLVTAYEKTPAGPTSVREPMNGESGSPRPGADENIDAGRGIGNPTNDMVDYWRAEAGYGRAMEPLYAVERPDGEVLTWTPSRQQAARILREEGGDLSVRRYDAPADVAADVVDGAPPRAIQGFDGPDDVAASQQIDSLEHDLRMLMMEDGAGDFDVRLTDDGDVMNAADVLAELDADEAAINAARACMVPPGGGGEA